MLSILCRSSDFLDDLSDSRRQFDLRCSLVRHLWLHMILRCNASDADSIISKNKVENFRKAPLADF